MMKERKVISERMNDKVNVHLKSSKDEECDRNNKGKKNIK